MTKSILDINYVKQVCIDRGFEPLFDHLDEYVNHKSKIKVRCKCDNECKIQFSRRI